jgi:broad specificity phosphatase PhoE
MKTIEVRRHSLTKNGEGRDKGSHLSQKGVQLARTIATTVGPCELVIVSPFPRTLETALAMGYAVDDILPVLGPAETLGEVGLYERWQWEKPFEMFARIIEQGGEIAKAAQNLAEAWKTALETIPDNGKILVISHGRLLEVGLIACLPGAPYADWGTPFKYMEGFSLEYRENRFSNLKFLRVPEHPNVNSY